VEGGRAAYSEAIQDDPNIAAYYFHRARVRYFAGDYPHALEDAGSATRLDPNNGEAFELLGDIDSRVKNPRKALADYTRAIELGVNTRPSYNSRAAAHTQLHEYDAAIADYTLGIKLRLDNPEPIRQRGDLYNALGRYRDAIDDYDQSISLKPDNPRRCLAAASVGDSSANIHKPLRTSTSCSRCGPNDAKALTLRGAANFRLMITKRPSPISRPP
jgi:tetratricopeptide (TPR) repeat protein